MDLEPLRILEIFWEAATFRFPEQSWTCRGTVSLLEGNVASEAPWLP